MTLLQMQEEVLRVKARCRYPSFAFDITKLAAAGENEIVVCAKDDNRSGRQPRGKQSEHFQSQGCVSSYFGMREICVDGELVRLNGKPLFQRLALDQGDYLRHRMARSGRLRRSDCQG